MKIFRILLLSLGCTLLNTQAFANEEEATDPASSAVQPGFAYHALDRTSSPTTLATAKPSAMYG